MQKHSLQSQYQYVSEELTIFGLSLKWIRADLYKSRTKSVSSPLN